MSVVSVDLGARPSAVVFLGTNWATLDAVTPASGTAIFRGMVAPSYDDPDVMAQSACVFGPAGDQHRIDNYAILNLTAAGSGAVLYRASVTITDTGFDADFDVGDATSYPIIFAAVFDVDALGFIGTASQSSLGFGFKAGASLLHGAWGGPVISGSDRTQDWYGGGAYPGDDPLEWMSAGMVVATFPTSQGGQYVNELISDRPTIRITTGMHFTGPFLTTSNIIAHPTGTELAEMVFGGDVEDGGMLLAWNDEDSATGFATIPSNVDDETTVSLPFAPGLVIGYSISDEPAGQGTGSRGAGGMSIVTADASFAALIDGVSTRGSFQSRSLGFCDRVTAAGAHGGTIELLPDGFKMKTTVAGVSPGSWMYHAFGHPAPTAIGLPQIYRRVRS